MFVKEAFELLTTRRSTRKYKMDPVPAEMLEKIIEAGRHAPSGGNSQTTHFIVIEDAEVLKRLTQLAEASFSAMEVTEGMYRSLANAVRAAKKGNYVFYYGAPVLIVTANQKDYGNNMADCACALENMMLMANALDLGSCWINQLRWLNEDPALLAAMQKLGLAENERVYGAVAIGFPDTEDGKPQRTPLPRKGNPVTYIK